MFSAREVSQAGIPPGGQTWQNVHLVYTHGFGAVASQVNTATTEGQPVFTLRDIPPVGDPALEGNGQRVYYGEGAQGDAAFVVVDTGTKELDFQGTATNDQAQATFTYDGDGGIPIGGFFQRALFAWRFRDVNLLISSLIQGDSRIMIYRDITQRVPKAAPFLKFDDDPYTAIVDGRLVWIWDGYTTTNQYPYSDFVDLADVAASANQTTSTGGTINYVRNSVKVVVDAFTGKMTYYVADPNDPIIEAWAAAFPTMFTPLDQAPPELLQHFRYPENLFQVQAFQYTKYHLTDANVFCGKQDYWALPNDPTVTTPTGTAGQAFMRPYYVLMRLPGETDESFVLILPFSPLDRQNMVAWLAAKSDPGPDYGHIVSFQFPSGVNVDGPTQVFSRINQDARFSSTRTFVGQGGSEIVSGDFLVIPLEDSLLYVQPVYVKSNQENAIPELKRVVVVNGTAIGIGTSLREALNDSIGTVVPPPTGGGGGGPPQGTTEQQIQQALDQASQHFAAADAALRQGDLATYQREIAAAQEATKRAQALIADLLGAKSTASPSPSPTGPTGASG